MTVTFFYNFLNKKIFIVKICKSLFLAQVYKIIQIDFLRSGSLEILKSKLFLNITYKNLKRYLHRKINLILNFRDLAELKYEILRIFNFLKFYFIYVITLN